MKIQVFGPGCKNCEVTEKLVRDAVAEAGIEADIEKVTDFQAIAEAGVLGTPAVSIDGEVKVSGRVPKADEVKAWLGGAA